MRLEHFIQIAVLQIFVLDFAKWFDYGTDAKRRKRAEGNNSLWVFLNIPRKLRITYVQFFVLGIYFEKLSGYTDNIKRQNC